MKKSVIEIIERNDYKRVNNALMARVPEVANIIQNKMEYLGIRDFSSCDERERLSIRAQYCKFPLFIRETQYNGGDKLCYVVNDCYDNLLCYDLSVSDENALFMFASGRAYNTEAGKYLIMNANKILEYLDELEDKIVSELKEELNNTDKLLNK